MVRVNVLAEFKRAVGKYLPIVHVSADTAVRARRAPGPAWSFESIQSSITAKDSCLVETPY